MTYNKIKYFITCFGKIVLKYTIIFILILLPISLNAIEVHVSPILFIDETDQGSRNTGRVQQELLSMLWTKNIGLVMRFNSLNDNRINAPQSITDAITVCRTERIDYLLYGYVSKNAHNMRMEIRLFDYINRRIIQTFFSMDDTDNYERLLDDMSSKIIFYIAEMFNLETIQEKQAFTRISIPVNAGYWTPFDKNWLEVMLGTVTLGSGVEFTPTDNLFVFRGINCYLSTGAIFQYRLGVGNPSRYEAYNHTFYITFPLTLNLVLSQQHGVFTGFGLVYFLEFFSMTEKYSASRSSVYGNMGINFNFGYRFMMGENRSLFFRNNFDFLINKNTLVSYSPVIGMNFQVYDKEVKRKW